MAGVSPTTGLPYNEDGPSEPQPPFGKWTALELALKVLGILGVSGSFLGFMVGMEARWFPMMPDPYIFAWAATFLSALAIATVFAGFSGDMPETLGRVGLALLASAFVSSAASVWTGRAHGIDNLTDRAATCERQQAELEHESQKAAFEAGRAFERSGCPELMRAAERFTRTSR